MIPYTNNDDFAEDFSFIYHAQLWCMFGHRGESTLYLYSDAYGPPYDVINASIWRSAKFSSLHGMVTYSQETRRDLAAWLASIQFDNLIMEFLL